MEQRSAGDSRTNTSRRPAPAEALEAISSGQLAGLILDSSDLNGFLGAFAAHAAKCFAASGADVGCGITVLHGRRPASAGFSDQRACLLDELQRAAGRGPCADAAHRQASVQASNLGSELRWPDYVAGARAHGVASLAAVPVNLRSDGRAALILHSTRSGHFDGPAVSGLEDFIGRAEPSLRLAVRFFGHASTARDLKAALESRTVIDQAVGIIMGQNRCSQHEAFTMLRSASGRRNLKLRDLAGQIVTGAGGIASKTHFDG